MKIFTVALFLFLIGCNNQEATSEKEGNEGDSSKRVEQNRLSADLLVAASHDLSCTGESECESLGFGNKACGGFTGYVVVSKNSEKYQSGEITDSIQKITAHEEKNNVDNQIISDCSLLGIPKATCKQNLCVAEKNEDKFE